MLRNKVFTQYQDTTTSEDPRQRLRDWSIAQKLNPCRNGNCKHGKAAINACIRFDHSDQTDYHVGRHFAAVASEMAHWLKCEGVPDTCPKWSENIIFAIRESFLKHGRYTTQDHAVDLYYEWEDRGRYIPIAEQQSGKREGIKVVLRKLWQRK